MSITIFKERVDDKQAGLNVFHPKHCTVTFDNRINAVYFPYMVHEGLLTVEKVEKLRSLISKKYIGTKLEFEAMNREVPRYLCNLYRKKMKKKP